MDKTVENEKKGENEAVNQNQWSELPRDILVMIFEKLNVNVLISVVSLVSRSWYLATFEPSLWSTIDMRLYADTNFLHQLYEHYLASWRQNVAFVKAAVDRSGGNITRIIFSINSAPTDKDLIYISSRTPKLKHLTLPDWSLLTNDGVKKAFGRWSELEHLAAWIEPLDSERSICKTRIYCLAEMKYCLCLKKMTVDLVRFIEDLGISCQKLKKLELSGHIFASQATAIATHIRGVQSLDLRYSYLSYKALSILLCSCKEVKYLNISHCYPIACEDKYNRRITFQALCTKFSSDLMQQALSVVETFHDCSREKGVGTCQFCYGCTSGGGLVVFEKVRLFWLYDEHRHEPTREEISYGVSIIPFHVYTLITGQEERFEDQLKAWREKETERASQHQSLPQRKHEPDMQQNGESKGGLQMVFGNLGRLLMTCIFPHASLEYYNQY